MRTQTHLLVKLCTITGTYIANWVGQVVSILLTRDLDSRYWYFAKQRPFSLRRDFDSRFWFLTKALYSQVLSYKPIHCTSTRVDSIVPRQNRYYLLFAINQNRESKSGTTLTYLQHSFACEIKKSPILLTKLAILTRDIDLLQNKGICTLWTSKAIKVHVKWN